MSELLFDDKDVTISVKKGFINLFQVNFEKKLLIEDDVLGGKTKQFTAMEVSLWTQLLCIYLEFEYVFNISEMHY